jgi:hypothetical protein
VLPLQTRRFMSALGLVSLAGCHEAASVARSPAAPDLPAVPSYLLWARGPTVMAARPGTPVLEAPTVMVQDQHLRPVVDLPVSFVVVSGGGYVSETRVNTQGNGLATCGGWILGTTAGQNTLVASVAGSSSIVFTAMGRTLQTGFESYDIHTIGARPLPVTYSGGGSTWDIVGGRYIFSDDGTFSQTSLVRMSDGVTRTNSFHGTYGLLTYGPLESSIMFYVDRKFFASGEVRGDVLTVTYDDWIDFEEEVYLRSP